MPTEKILTIDDERLVSRSLRHIWGSEPTVYIRLCTEHSHLRPQSQPRTVFP